MREVAVLGGSAASRDLADEAGADIYPADAFAQAIERSRGPWLLGLPLSAIFEPHWVEALGAEVAREPATPARLVSGGLALTPRPEGWLVPKALALSAAATGQQDLQRLARRSGRRLRILGRG